jgi:hypothetical protein
MDTVTRTAQEPRSTERLVEALSTLAALLDRTINEVRTLDSDFQNRLMQAVQETEASVRKQAAEHLQRTIRDTEQKVRKETSDSLKAQFEIDMRSALMAMRTEMEVEFKKNIGEMSAQFDEQRRWLNADLDRANQAAREAEAASLALTEKANTPPPKSGLDVEIIMTEVERVESLVAEISDLMDEPGVEFSTVVRKNVQRAELESYLKGIRFALGK